MALPLKIDADARAFTGFTPFGQERHSASLNLPDSTIRPLAVQNGFAIFGIGKNFSPADPPCL